MASSSISSPAEPRSANRRNLFFPVTVFIMSALLLFLSGRLFLPGIQLFFDSENERFEKFTSKVFCEEISSNTLNLHYTIANPDTYGVDPPEPSLGNASLSARQAACAALENYKNTLEQFDYTQLSSKNQLTYDVFQDYVNTELSAAGLLLYDEPLSETLGVQAQLPILLAEYTFRTKGDIEEYLSLLARIPDYFATILSFERDKAGAGLFMSPESAAAVAAQCAEFTEVPSDNYLIRIFDEKIDSFTNLTADEKISYKNRNKAILTGYVIPAYQELQTKILSYAGSSKNTMGLYYLPDGSTYYEYLVKSKTGDSRKIEEIEEAVKTSMVSDFSSIQKLLKENPSLMDTASPSANDSSVESSPIDILSTLRQAITRDFPVLPQVSCDVKYVHQSLQKYLSPAFYLTPAIDDYKNNVIYINPEAGYSGLELFTTLAHEGYPGHLYQTVYFHAQSPDPLRSLLDVGGYTEGWATYVEMYSYSLWPGDQKMAELYRRNRSFTLGLASLLDIGIHYHGYTPEKVRDFLSQLGFGTETADSLYRNILQAPANYLQYFIGYLNFCDLREEMKANQGEQFSLKDFHRQILEAGPAPFSVLRNCLINNNR